MNRFDGFALNIGTDVWTPAQVEMAYAAALASGLSFRLFISFDMSQFVDETQASPF